MDSEHTPEGWTYSAPTLSNFEIWRRTMDGHQITVIKQDLLARERLRRPLEKRWRVDGWTDRYYVLWNGIERTLPLDDSPIEEILARALWEVRL
jgi:hypothetical protein